MSRKTTLSRKPKVIESLTGKSCAALFADDGEEQFRSIETAVLTQVQAYVRMIVGTGGGIVKKDENWGRLQRCAWDVHS